MSTPADRGTRRSGTVAVLAAWLVSRALTATLLTVVGSRTAPDVDSSRLLIWDGGWYREIMLNGYGERPATWPPGLGQWTPLPFFPLYPAASSLLHDIGLPVTLALTSLPNLALLVALFGIYRLAERHEGHEVAVTAVWITAVLPGALTFTMAYPDAIFLAASTWAVVWASNDRHVLAGLAAAVTTATRPNGALVVVTLVLLLLTTPRRAGTPRSMVVACYALPSAAFLGFWMWYMDRRVDDPLAFVTAKQAWDETTLVEALRTPTNQTTWQIAIGLAAIAVVVATRRRQPVAWTVHSLMCILPAFALGVVGLIRYSAHAFGVPIGLASLVRRRGTAVAAGAVGVCTVLLVVYAVLVTRNSYLP